jgi:hypothetical protein
VSASWLVDKVAGLYTGKHKHTHAWIFLHQPVTLTRAGFFGILHGHVFALPALWNRIIRIRAVLP